MDCEAVNSYGEYFKKSHFVEDKFGFQYGHNEKIKGTAGRVDVYLDLITGQRYSFGGKNP